MFTDTVLNFVRLSFSTGTQMPHNISTPLTSLCRWRFILFYFIFLSFRTVGMARLQEGDSHAYQYYNASLASSSKLAAKFRALGAKLVNSNEGKMKPPRAKPFLYLLSRGVLLINRWILFLAITNYLLLCLFGLFFFVGFFFNILQRPFWHWSDQN